MVCDSEFFPSWNVSVRLTTFIVYLSNIWIIYLSIYLSTKYPSNSHMQTSNLKTSHPQTINHNQPTNHTSTHLSNPLHSPIPKNTSKISRRPSPISLPPEQASKIFSYPINQLSLFVFVFGFILPGSERHASRRWEIEKGVHRLGIFCAVFETGISRAVGWRFGVMWWE